MTRILMSMYRVIAQSRAILRQNRQPARFPQARERTHGRLGIWL